ncbi:MAG: UDP-glucose--hexose-1-phosphate uridylyltransferase [Acidimicrobiia bacterium]
MTVPTYDGPHRRYNPLTGEWVLVSEQRTSRPWQGQTERPTPDTRPQFDPTCYLCPGTERAGGVQNETYDGTYVFTNDFPALVPSGHALASSDDGLFVAQEESGTCRVVCFSPRHDLTLAEMDLPDIERVIDVWADQTAELGRSHAWVQVFENRGSAMGASNPHPHGQIWATSHVPTLVATEDDHQRRFAAAKGEVLLDAYARREQELGTRTVVENEDWLIVVPFWAVWPFEALVLPKVPVLRITDLNDRLRANLAAALKEMLIRYDNLFQTPFPYSMGWHGAPFTDGPHDHWRLHAHIDPPLLRSATVRKFMVGYELAAESQRDLTAEFAAERLRSLPTIHYSNSLHAAPHRG